MERQWGRAARNRARTIHILVLAELRWTADLVWMWAWQKRMMLWVWLDAHLDLDGATFGGMSQFALAFVLVLRGKILGEGGGAHWARLPTGQLWMGLGHLGSKWRPSSGMRVDTSRMDVLLTVCCTLDFPCTTSTEDILVHRPLHPLLLQQLGLRTPCTLMLANPELVLFPLHLPFPSLHLSPLPLPLLHLRPL